jgi:excisionase family DNA binding protein
MENKQYYTVIELAGILGISRIAVFKKIKKGEIKAQKIGRNFAITKTEVMGILGSSLTKDQKKTIDQALKKTIAEYGETLKLLGDA